MRVTNNGQIRVVVGVDGDGTNTWNANGTTILVPSLSNVTTDLSGFTVTSGDTGYGSIVTTGQFTIASHTLELKTTHILLENSAYFHSSYELKNVGSTIVSNLRIWVGVRDDRIDGDDSPNKVRGNIVSGAFQQISSASTASNAIREASGSADGAFVLHSTHPNIGTVLANYGDLVTRIIQLIQPVQR